MEITHYSCEINMTSPVMANTSRSPKTPQPREQAPGIPAGRRSNASKSHRGAQPQFPRLEKAGGHAEEHQRRAVKIKHFALDPKTGELAARRGQEEPGSGLCATSASMQPCSSQRRGSTQREPTASFGSSIYLFIFLHFEQMQNCIDQLPATSCATAKPRGVCTWL